MDMDIFKVFLFLLLALCGKCKEIYKRAGEKIDMDCKVSGNTDVRWKFNDMLIFSLNGKRGTIQKGTSHLVKKAKLYGGVLHIPNLEPTDSGDYFCSPSEEKYTVHVVSVFAKPNQVLVSGGAELHCDIEGRTDVKVQWLRPPKDEVFKERSQVIHLNHVTVNEGGDWKCQIEDFKFPLTLTVVEGLKTNDVNASEGDDVVLPCSLPKTAAQRVVGGTWKAEHLSTVLFPTLTNTEGKGLHWKGENSSKVAFTNEQLHNNFNVTLRTVQRSYEGKYVCTVNFDSDVTLTAAMFLTVRLPADKKKSLSGQVTTLDVKETMTRNVFGVQLWVWIAVGTSSVVLIGLIAVTVLVKQRNKRMKRRVRKLRSMRQPLTANDYCQCNRHKTELKMGFKETTLSAPRQKLIPHTRAGGPTHTDRRQIC